MEAIGHVAMRICHARVGIPQAKRWEIVLLSQKSGAEIRRVVAVPGGFCMDDRMIGEGLPLLGSLRVLLANCRTMEAQLLAGALRSQGCSVYSCQADARSILGVLEEKQPDVVIVKPPSATTNVSMLRAVHFSSVDVPKIVLIENDQREVVVQAFRFGARGIFCLADSSFVSLCECIQKVHRGEIWASTRQLGYLLDAVSQVPSLQVTSASGEKLLTSREEQVVALVADGLSNRNVATELGLSEHTVKKYMFRIFDKLGISNRVELVLYAIHHGATPQAEWVAMA
jgi:DNA-binding NarL/FixJ family response regulator